ncbi:hypothetical protein ASPSYDRAFT_46411 [Aspergillus sydowii CBS 593.65]|uniref:Uncharacterized protein n=1 Tax=Aspergillus sydowii CBS 593.65 TaxID=1036612 RepID=A0A1L9TGH3_9EURO|nr:uncharacterized protein ASPSYDRAFT_46411 [Aspergillus sydowii CBS 593.65]OJJ58393.1 hypothetical protein ASPSYDRAFT_46411 [Aspergillus sydowii CBS 593.65]
MAFCPITTYDLRKYLEGESVMPYMAFNLSTWISDSVAEGGRLLPENPAAGKVVSDGLESVVGAVAASLTKAAISASNYTVLGTVYTSEVYIDVDWIWLLLPAALITFGTLFLVLTVLTNRRQRLHPWKSSMLAVLFHGLSNMETEGMMNGRSTVGQMEKTAQNIQVRLRTVDQRRGLMLDQS